MGPSLETTALDPRSRLGSLVYMHDVTAIQRTPVEIWGEIISLVLETWLLPGSGEHILDDLLLFNFSCLTTMEYRRVETIRRHLSAVCRSWKAITDNHDICLTVTDFWRKTLPSEPHIIRARRIQTPSVRCYCRRCPYSFPATAPGLKDFRDIWPTTFGDQYSFESLLKPENVRLVSLGILKRDITSYLQNAHRLTAFGGSLCILWQEKELQLHKIFERLTHLEIRTLSLRSVMIKLGLPSLRSLHLYFHADPVDVISGPIHIRAWKFPRLVSFLVGGTIRREDNNDFLQFILGLSPTLRNLIIDYGFVEPGFPPRFQVGIDFLQQFRHLEVLGVAARFLPTVCGQLDIVNTKDLPLGLSLLLVDIHYISSFDTPDVESVGKEYVRLCQHPKSIFRKVIIALTWGQLLEKWELERIYNRSATILRNIDSLRGISPFFAEIYKSDVVFLDRDGVELRQGDGLKLLKRMEAYGMIKIDV
ncbi:hypothetical protein FRC17_002296 [Serendipita sp. 399]|nr:hypothetical protein FRC17_002296 [Serendipita sp. 399]